MNLLRTHEHSRQIIPENHVGTVMIISTLHIISKRIISLRTYEDSKNLILEDMI